MEVQPERTTPCCTPFGSSLSAHLACSLLRRLSEVHLCWSSLLIPCTSPPLCWQFPLRLTVRWTGHPVVTLSPKLHTESLPTSHVRVGNDRWNGRFRKVHITCSPLETEIHATFRSHSGVKDCAAPPIFSRRPFGPSPENRFLRLPPLAVASAIPDPSRLRCGLLSSETERRHYNVQ
ncbi:hypothetical protein ACVIKP_005143 [Rhizobium leguminosarum]